MVSFQRSEGDGIMCACECVHVCKREGEAGEERRSGVKGERGHRLVSCRDHRGGRGRHRATKEEEVTDGRISRARGSAVIVLGPRETRGTPGPS